MGECCEPVLVNPISRKFFNDYTNTEDIQKQKHLSEKIKLQILVNNINSNCKYKIKVYNTIGNKNYSLNEFGGNCSIFNNSVAKLDSPIIISYFFEKQQQLLFEIFIIENGITKKYDMNIFLGRIMGSRNNTFQSKVSSNINEIIVVQAEKLKESEKDINIKLEIPPNGNINFNVPKNQIYYEIYSDIILYRSECLNTQGKFFPIRIPLNLFKNNLIRIIFYKNTKQLIQELNLNIFEFSQQKAFNINCNGITLQVISKSKITKNYTFVDYLKAGIEIGLSVAIDFTRSNGDPNNPSSLHYIHGNQQNQYERSILACGDIVGFYDFDQLYPCFGFGAKINGAIKQIFNLNFQENPNVSYIEGILDEYHNAINKVELWGPTNFAPIIREINKIIKEEKNKLKYHILMILTDGIIDDMDDTIDELVEGSFLPLSVIIIGVGNADFSNMINLDHDNNLLVNSKRVKAARDLVQFVPFLRYESNPEQLAFEVLEEIPRQIVDYYEQNNIDPFNLTL